MMLSALKSRFLSELEALYPKEEIKTFFYRLCEHYLDMRRIDVALSPNRRLNSKESETFEMAINRLKAEEPLQYILGTTEFFGLPFKVNPSVLIPRPETEELVEWIIGDARQNLDKYGKEPQALRILDIGTGSGCIAIALAKNLPFAQVYAVDISEEALEVAKGNAALNGLDIQFISADILEKNDLLFSNSEIRFDIIVSNPPYVRELERVEMKANVLNNEPHGALFVPDDDALIFYRKIASLAFDNLKPKGVVYFEINQYLGEATRILLDDTGFKEVELRKDIFNKERMLKGKKS